MLNKYYPPHLGGIEFHMRDLAEALVATGVEVEALVSNDGPEGVRESVNGVVINRLSRLFEYASTPVALGLRRHLRHLASSTAAPDIFHLHFPYPWGEVSWLAAGTRIPTVMTYHSDIVRQKAALAAYRPMLERVLDRVDRIIVSSPNMVRHSEFLASRVDKCKVIPFGVHVERYIETPEVMSRASLLKERHGTRKIVLFVGRLVYYKGVDILMRAIRSVDADLVVIGRGPLEATMREYADSHGMSGRVFFEPPVSDEDLRAWYRAADVFCLPSVARSEAFGLVQVEAHASGLPVVSTNLTTGVPFVNEHGVSGLVVPPGDVTALADALNTLLSDDELRARLGRQAYDRAHRQFSIGRMTSDTRTLYEELRAGAGR